MSKNNICTNVPSSQTFRPYLVYIELSFKLYLSICIREQVIVRIWHLFLIAFLYIHVLFFSSIVQWKTLRLPLPHLQICLFMSGPTGKNSQYDVTSFLNYTCYVDLIGEAYVSLGWGTIIEWPWKDKLVVLYYNLCSTSNSLGVWL
jgi:hypothetical protein